MAKPNCKITNLIVRSENPAAISQNPAARFQNPNVRSQKECPTKRDLASLDKLRRTAERRRRKNRERERVRERERERVRERVRETPLPFPPLVKGGRLNQKPCKVADAGNIKMTSF
jgi:hypothetical protein